MEAQLQRPHQYEEDPHIAGLRSGGVEGEHDHHHGEKKSVLKKVKDKAKKLKNTITKHGHGHEQEYRHDQVSEEDDDEDNEMVNDPEIHGAPIYDSPVITGTSLPMQTGLNLEKPNDVREDQYNPNVRNEGYTTLEEIGAARSPAPGKMETEFGDSPFEARHEPERKNPLHSPNVQDIGITRPFDSGKMDTGLERQTVEARHEPESKNPLHYSNVENIGINKPFGSDKMDTGFGNSPFEAGHEPESKNHLHYSNVEDIGVTRPFGSDEMETGLGRQPVEARHEPEIIKPLQNPIEEDVEVTRPFSQDIMDTELERQPVKTAHHEPEMKKNPLQYPDVNIGYGADKSEPGSGMPPAMADESHETDLLDPLLNKPSPVEMEETKAEEPSVKIGPLTGLEKDPHSFQNRPSNYQSKVVDPTGKGGKEADVGPLAERLGNVHIQDKSESSPVQEQGLYTGSHDQFAPQPTPTKEEFEFNPDPNPLEVSQNPESPKAFDAGRPDSMPRDTITGKISSATHVIADKAVSAKNVVASKLGYGGGQQSQHEESQEVSSRRPVSKTAADYGSKVAEKLSPVYEKVAGAGSAILSKVQGGGEAVEYEGNDEVVKGADKGVSVKEYLAVKLRPGDEDKALSEVITEALQRKKEAVPRTGAEERVTETEDAAADLGKRRERADEVVAGSESSGGGVVDRLKGAVSSWLGKGTESASSGGIENRGEEVGSQQSNQATDYQGLQ